MPEEVKRKRGRPPKNKTENNIIETNLVQSSTVSDTYEYNSMSARQLSEYCFGLDIFGLYDSKQISNMIENPMANNEELRKLSNKLYSSNGLLTQCIDYCTSLPTLDYCVIPRGKSKQKR